MPLSLWRDLPCSASVDLFCAVVTLPTVVVTGELFGGRSSSVLVFAPGVLPRGLTCVRRFFLGLVPSRLAGLLLGLSGVERGE